MDPQLRVTEKIGISFALRYGRAMRAQRDQMADNSASDTNLKDSASATACIFTHPSMDR